MIVSQGIPDCPLLLLRDHADRHLDVGDRHERGRPWWRQLLHDIEVAWAGVRRRRRHAVLHGHHVGGRHVHRGGG